MDAAARRFWQHSTSIATLPYGACRAFSTTTRAFPIRKTSKSIHTMKSRIPQCDAAARYAEIRLTHESDLPARSGFGTSSYFAGGTA